MGALNRREASKPLRIICFETEIRSAYHVITVNEASLRHCLVDILVVRR